MRGHLNIGMLLFLTALTVPGCEPEPQPVHVGSDQCAHCRMLITEPAFASQSLNQKGRSFKFDSIECMAAHEITFVEPDHFHSHWVPDFFDHDIWVPAAEAWYLHSETLRSPMGLHLSGYSDRVRAEEQLEEYKGTLIRWNEVRELVSNEWFPDQGTVPGAQLNGVQP